ncbi:MAG: hypothetical protein AAGF77_09005 [Bacteroidota bacterium]
MQRFLFLWICLFLTLSCSEEQDFDQADDLTLTPTVASSIFYFESDEPTINLADNNAFYQEDFTFEAFNEDFVAERVLDGVITYQLENTTSKTLSLIVQFLTATGAVLDTETFTVEAAPTALLERQVAYGDGGKPLDILVNTRVIRLTAENLGDATSVSSSPEPKIILRSSAAFGIQLR